LGIFTLPVAPPEAFFEEALPLRAIYFFPFFEAAFLAFCFFLGLEAAFGSKAAPCELLVTFPVLS
jgi:hypothetical protein